MPRKNRRDPFAGVAPPSARHPRILVLREIAGRMRNIAIEKHLPNAGPCAPAIESLIAGLRSVLDRDFAHADDLPARRAELRSVLSAACDALSPLQGEEAKAHLERYRRWSERLARF